jgi:hypothetical protein
MQGRTRARSGKGPVPLGGAQLFSGDSISWTLTKINRRVNEWVLFFHQHRPDSVQHENTTILTKHRDDRNRLCPPQVATLLNQKKSPGVNAGQFSMPFFFTITLK